MLLKHKELMIKPKLDKSISATEFKANYWLKEELVIFCRSVGIKTTGGKIEIANRVLRYLETGEVVNECYTISKATKSNFDWGNASLNSNTLITDNYRNSENVREFFKNAIGSNFKFNVEFMNWMKLSAGKTLGDAVCKWKEIAEIKRSKNYKTHIAPQFEYNTYIRDFLADNPQLTLKQAIESWKIKREKPEAKKYNKGDLDYIL